MKRALIAALSIAFLGSTAYAAPCRDPAGKFIKCAPVAAKKCRDTKGKFVKCDAATTPPA